MMKYEFRIMNERQKKLGVKKIKTRKRRDDKREKKNSFSDQKTKFK